MIEKGDGWVLRGKKWVRNPDQTRLPVFQCVRCGLVWADKVDMPECV